MYRTAHPDPVTQSEFYADVATKRLLAWMFDTVIIALIVAVAIPFTGFLALFFLGGLYLGVNFLYRLAGLARYSSTIGMSFVRSYSKR